MESQKDWMKRTMSKQEIDDFYSPARGEKRGTWDDLQERIARDIREHPMDGYKPAFLGAMDAWGKSMSQAVGWIEHVTGTGKDSVAHYLPTQCETCIEISKFINDWKQAGSKKDAK